MQAIDVRHLGRERVICCWRVGDVLIDPGPESSLATLLDALGDEPPRALLLTHIHLDHAGAAGALVRRWPEVVVYVHERGAPHLDRPLQAAGQRRAAVRRRDAAPVGRGRARPARALRPLAGGETRRGLPRGLHPGPRLPPRRATSTRTAAAPSSATWRACGSSAATSSSPRPRRPTSTSRRGTRSLDRWSPSGSPSRSALTHFGAVDEPYAAAGHGARPPRRWAHAGARARRRRRSRRHVREEVAAAVDPEDRRGLPPGRAARAAVARPRPLLAQARERVLEPRGRGPIVGILAA